MLRRFLRELRAHLRRHGLARRLLFGAAAPWMPALRPWAARLQAPRYATWFERWQTSGPADDDAIRAALAGPQPPFLIHIGEGARGERTRASLAAQVGPSWQAVTFAEAEHLAATGEDPLRRCAEAGGYVLWLEAGEILSRHALARLAIASAEHPRPAILVADEDALDSRGRHRDAWFKSAFDPDRLLQQNTFGRAVAYDAKLVLGHGLGRLRGHALALFASRAAGEAAIRHVPAILLHRDPTDVPAPWSSETDPAAVAAFLTDQATGARVVDATARPLRIGWPVPHPAPSVSIIVPTRDRAGLLCACIEGLLHRTAYAALEIIIVDNDSRQPEALALLEGWASDPRVRVLRHPGPFDYAAINNRAAAEARGEVLVLLNNDTEVLHDDWLRELVSHAVRPRIGAVGAHLLFPDGRLQHAGVVLGVGGVAGHDLLFSPPGEAGPQDALRLVRSVSAVSAACLAIRRELFLAVGGFDAARFRVAYNDVDLCLRVAQAGYRNIVTPHARLLHRESASRGSDFTPQARERWETERAAMRTAWGTVLDQDPFFSPFLTLETPYRTLAAVPRARLPWQRQPEKAR